VTALDLRCPHMGADLGFGRVKADTIVCPFHQWAFDSTGRCVDIPYEGCGWRNASDCRNRVTVWVTPPKRTPRPSIRQNRKSLGGKAEGQGFEP
jgi:3-ketosteroid 9alpha-monooxygenase subunit A